MITKQDLEARRTVHQQTMAQVEERLQKLQQEGLSLAAQMQMHMGAINDCDHWLKLIEATEKDAPMLPLAGLSNGATETMQ